MKEWWWYVCGCGIILFGYIVGTCLSGSRPFGATCISVDDGVGFTSQ